MRDPEPRVSICIPTYNRASMVRLAIESALGQTYQDIEVVVVDNASTDNIEEVIADYSDPRLRLVKNRENVGQFGNFNRCIEVSRGEFLHILHSDDYIEPDFTEICVRFFDSHPGVALTFTSAVLESPERTSKIQYAESDQVIPAPEGFRRLVRNDNFIICPSVMTRRSIYETAGKYSYQYPYSGDFYQWLKSTLLFDIGYVRNAVVHYREGEHSESYSLIGKSPTGYLDMIKIMTQIISDLGENYPVFQSDLNVYFDNYISLCHNTSQIIINNRITGFNPLVFSGLALTAWGMIQPQNRGELYGKGRSFVKIWLYFLITCIALFRRNRPVTQYQDSS